MKLLGAQDVMWSTEKPAVLGILNFFTHSLTLGTLIAQKAGIVVQWVQLFFDMLASHVRVLVQVLASLLPIQLPITMTGKSMKR